MSTDYTFEGWAGLDDKACEGGLKFQSYEPKKWDEDDVDGQYSDAHTSMRTYSDLFFRSVKILYCAICGSDASALSGEWGPVEPNCPQVCGHEIIGEVVRVGSQPENGLKVGMLVGTGPQSDSCRECEYCEGGGSSSP